VLFKNGLELFDNEATFVSIANDLTTKVIIKADTRALLASNNLKKHPKADVAVLKIGASKENGHCQFLPTVKLQEKLPPNVGFLGLGHNAMRRFADVGITNEIIMFGYPGSLGKDSQIDRSRPLLRQGMVAGKTDDGRIVVDCPVYFGNSGGLVVEIDEEMGKTFGIGLAVEMVPFVEELWSRQFNTQTGVRYENSGYALVEPMDRVEELF
jgi:hypothetical protein